MSLCVAFENMSGLADSDVYVSFLVPTAFQANFDVTYGDGTPVKPAAPCDLMTSPLSVKQIGTEGLCVTWAESAVIYVSYGAPLVSTTSAPSYAGAGTDFDIPFQTCELTMMGNAGDQGNLTAINYFTAPMILQSRAGTQLLQKTGYRDTANDMGADMGGCAPSAVVVDNDAPLRVIGPSSFTAGQPWPSFEAYLQAVHSAGQVALFRNINGFVEGGDNYAYTFALKCTVGADKSISSAGGNVAVRNLTAQTNIAIYEDTDITLSGTSQTDLDQVIYGQADVTPSIVTWGAGWSDVQNQMTALFGTTTGAANFETLQATVIGEITSGFLMGLVNSPVVPNGTTTALKDMASRDWWALDPILAFSDAQTANSYYNTYADILYRASKNTVYSVPYSDRLGTGPLVNSVQYDGQTVTSWMLTLLPPLSDNGGWAAHQSKRGRP